MLDIVTTVVQGEDVLLEISDDNEESWYRLCCLTKQGNKNNRAIKQTPTQCGPVVGKGSSVNRTVDFEGYMNVIADDVVDGIGYASGKKMKEWHNAGTALIVRQIKGDGTDYINKSDAYIQDYNEDIPVDDAISFNGSFVMFGTWTFSA